jgi:hypothetical protein
MSYRFHFDSPYRSMQALCYVHQAPFQVYDRLYPPDPLIFRPCMRTHSCHKDYYMTLVTHNYPRSYNHLEALPVFCNKLG